MLGQCSFSQKECVDIVGIPWSVHHNLLEDFHKLNCNVVKDNIENFHLLNSDRVIIKFSKSKDCKKVLSVKYYLKSINMADLYFEGNGSIYIQSKFMLLLQNAMVMEQEAGKNLLVCVWWDNQSKNSWTWEFFFS